MTTTCARRVDVDPALERSMLRVGREMQRAGFVAGTAGNLSARLADGLFLVTPSGLRKGRLAAADLLVVDGDGAVVRGRRGLSPTSETPMHLEVYRRRADVNAVVHAHPVHAVALSLTAADDLERSTLPEAYGTFGRIAVTRYSPPSSPQNGEVVAEAVEEHDAVVLAWHGSLTLGATLDEAYLRLEVLEHTARILAVARTLGPVPVLGNAELREIRDHGRAYRARSAAPPKR